MTSREIYGLPATATDAEVEAAARQHASECAKGMHGAQRAVRVPVPAGKVWDQARSCWVDAETLRYGPNGEGPYVYEGGDCLRLADLNESDADLPVDPELSADELAQLAE